MFRPFTSRLAGLSFILVLVEPSSRSLCTEFTPKSAGFQVAEKACLWMPPSFRRLMQRFMPDLERGVSRVTENRLLAAPERLRLESEVLDRASEVVGKLQSRPKFREVGEDLGVLAQMIYILNLPDVEGSSADEIAALDTAVRWNSASFRVVVYDSSEPDAGAEAVRTQLRETRNRRAILSERFRQSYLRATLGNSPAKLDPRSPLYGVASLVYSHSINDVARVWLWIWRAAHGDMSGRPSWGSQPE